MVGASADNRTKMTAQPSLFSGSDTTPRRRLVRDGFRENEANPVDHFALRSGEMYRISYSVGGSSQRRVTRSVAIYGGQTERRVWSGDVMPCLDFALPQGRTLSLLTDQLVDARPAELNERGQWVLQQPEGRRRRAPRRHYGGLS
jgi:hypothetical protein